MTCIAALETVFNGDLYSSPRNRASLLLSAIVTNIVFFSYLFLLRLGFLRTYNISPIVTFNFNCENIIFVYFFNLSITVYSSLEYSKLILKLISVRIKTTQALKIMKHIYNLIFIYTISFSNVLVLIAPLSFIEHPNGLFCSPLFFTLSCHGSIIWHYISYLFLLAYSRFSRQLS